MELNPGFDGKVAGSRGKALPKIEKGVVTELGFATYNVTNISPVRALGGLKQLDSTVSGGKGKLSDLSPLQGLQLEALRIRFNPVFDLPP